LTELEVEDINDDAVNHEFRIQWKTFSAALAAEVYWNMNHRSQMEAKEFVKSAFNIDVEFGPCRVWSNTSIVALILRCILFRVRWWKCKDQGLLYPNRLVEKLVGRSCYMNSMDLYSILIHTRQALIFENETSMLAIQELIDVIQSLSPDLPFRTDIGDVIVVSFKTEFHSEPFGIKSTVDHVRDAIETPLLGRCKRARSQGIE